MRLLFHLQILTTGLSLSSAASVPKRELLSNDLFNCDTGCDLTLGDPVCGEDDVSYQNQCLAVCQDIPIKHAGECAGDKLMTDTATYDHTTEISRESMDRYKKENYVFVAKRKFKDFVKPSEVEKKETEVGRSKGKGVFRGSYKMPSKDPLIPYYNNTTKQNDVVFIHRVTSDGDEYFTKVTTSDVNQLINTHVASKHPGNFYNGNHRTLEGRGIVGTDSRSEICLSPSCFPYSTIGEFDSRTVQGGCTGTVISSKAVLTAAHCQYIHGDWTDLEYFAPGRFRSFNNPPTVPNSPGDVGTAREPYGTWNADERFVFNAWQKDEDMSYDISVVTFKEQRFGRNYYALGEVTGSMGYAITTNNAIELQSATVTGYPYDKPDGTMWTSGPCQGGFREGFDSQVTYHNCDTVRGMDGAALLDLEAEMVYGVYSKEILVGMDYPDQAYVNLGVVLNEKNFPLIQAVAGM